MVKVSVVVCHPYATSFTAASLTAVQAGLASAGHEVRVTDLYAEGFDPVMSAHERATHRDGPEGKIDIAAHAERLRWCDALVLVYPTWWSGQPAMLKGWIDRVWVSGVAWHLPDAAGTIRPLLTNIRRIVVVTSHGSSKVVNMIEGEAGKRIVTRSIRVLCHRFARTNWLSLYNIDNSTMEQRQAFLRKVERRFSKL